MVRFPLFLLFALAGCAPSLDVDQARICRMVLPAISPADAEIDVLGARTDDDGAGVVVSYTLDSGHNPSFRTVLHCRFANAHAGRYRLAGVTTDIGTMSATQLYLLRRFWLETREAWASDPAPVPGSQRVTQVPGLLAYSLQQTLNALPLAALYGLLALAYSLVYGLVGRINLAFGEFAAIGGYAAVFGVVLTTGAAPFAPLLLALAFALGASAFHGIVAGRLVFAPLAGAKRQHGLVASIGLALFFQEYLRLTQGSSQRWINGIFNQPVPVLRAGDFIVTVTPIALFVAGLAALCACGLLIIMKFTRFGRDWRAYADDPRAAALFGVNPATIFARTFALACAMAGLSGYVMTIFYGSFGYGDATALGLKALVAAILGGIGSVPGAFLGGVAIGFAEALWSAWFPGTYRDLVIYALLIVLLMLRPGGFLGFGELDPRRV